MKINTSQIQKRTKEENEISNLKQHNKLCKIGGYLTTDEIDGLSEDEKINILKNTINKIKSYYDEKGIDNLSTTYSSNEKFKIYPLNWNERTKQDNIDYIKVNYTKFFKHKYVNRFCIFIDKKEKFYLDMYKYAIRFYKFRSKYISNKLLMDKLIEVQKVDTNKIINSYFPNELNECIEFHKKISENQLNQYYNYHYPSETDDKKITEMIQAGYEVFYLLFRTQIKKITIDTTLKNPYEELSF